MTKKILFAKINSVFGIKGDVKIIVFSNNPENIEKYSLFDSSGNSLKIKISNKNKTVIGTSSGNPIIIAKIDGINDRNAAELMRGKEIFTNRTDFEATNEDEFYYVDLIGLDVVDNASKKIGKVINILDHGAGGVIEIKFDEISDAKNHIDNFPFKNEIFPEVNLKEKFIRFEMPQLVETKE